MTYRELLFKMAQLDMLTLSNDKDGRGLFWVSMNNLDALEKEFDWVDFKGCPDLKEKEYYIDEQGRKIEKHKNYEYSQPLFSEARRENWICKHCGESTFQVDYEYLVDIDEHLECSLKKENT